MRFIGRRRLPPMLLVSLVSVSLGLCVAAEYGSSAAEVVFLGTLVILMLTTIRSR